MTTTALIVCGLLVGTTGCDSVFGLDNSELVRCDLGAFDATATPTRLASADAFAIAQDQSFVVGQDLGIPFEQDGSQDPATIDLGGYVDIAFGLAPERDRVFFTAMIEPPVLMTATRSTPGTWQLDGFVPKGTYAGSPSEQRFGSRLLVKLRPNADAVQEYAVEDGQWTAVGSPQSVTTQFAPNLTPNGLTMVYPGFDGDGAPAVLAAQRSSLAEWFAAPTVILTGAHASPQLSASCRQLFVVDNSILDRYDR